jgi:hypothetical protein
MRVWRDSIVHVVKQKLHRQLIHILLAEVLIVVVISWVSQ